MSAGATTENEECVGAAPDYFDSVMRTEEQVTTEAMRHGFDVGTAHRIGEVSAGLQCIRNLSLLVGRFSVERQAAEDGNEGCALLSPLMEGALIESMGIMASLLDRSVAAIARDARVGAQR